MSGIYSKVIMTPQADDYRWTGEYCTTTMRNSKHERKEREAITMWSLTTSFIGGCLLGGGLGYFCFWR